MASAHVEIYLEKGGKRTFAGALDWPGWCRSGKTPDEAIAALVAYGDRYAKVAGRAKVSFTPPEPGKLNVVEQLKGTATTDFGAPGVAPRADSKPLDARELKRQLKLLEACWEAFEAAAHAARGVKLRTGPRGGGRTLPKIVDHVLEAEEGYLGALGAKKPRTGQERDPAARLHDAVVEALRARAEGRSVAVPRNTKKPWSPRFFLRRAAWHVLDHAWEIEDRARPDSRSKVTS
jgi:hypothetical protein